MGSPWRHDSAKTLLRLALVFACKSWWKDWVFFRALTHLFFFFFFFPLPNSIMLFRFWRQSSKHAGRFFQEISVKVKITLMTLIRISVCFLPQICYLSERCNQFSLNNTCLCFQESRSMLLDWLSRLLLILRTWR